jgi:hypothetical protein
MTPRRSAFLPTCSAESRQKNEHFKSIEELMELLRSASFSGGFDQVTSPGQVRTSPSVPEMLRKSHRVSSLVGAVVGALGRRVLLVRSVPRWSGRVNPCRAKTAPSIADRGRGIRLTKGLHANGSSAALTKVALASADGGGSLVAEVLIGRGWSRPRPFRH